MVQCRAPLLMPLLLTCVHSIRDVDDFEDGALNVEAGTSVNYAEAMVKRTMSEVGSTGILLSRHTVCRDNSKRNPEYPERTTVPDAKVFWSFAWPAYSPVSFTHPNVLAASWADPPTVVTDPMAPQWEDPLHMTYFSPADPTMGMMDVHLGAKTSVLWQQRLVPEKRLHYLAPTPGGASIKWDIPHDGNLPLNPMGRTGISGRGTLDRFGANHAADPIVTRVKDGHLEVVVIQRKDGGKIALPGGRVEAGKTVSATLGRQFELEALRGDKPDEVSEGEWEIQIAELDQKIRPVFEAGKLIYTGYVDDPRNTDNAWLETAAYHFHDGAGIFDRVQLKKGTNAIGIRWAKVADLLQPDIEVYGSHKQLIMEMYRQYVWDVLTAAGLLSRD